MYKVNATLVYGSFGIVEVLRIENKCYVVKAKANGLILVLPFDKPGLRPLATPVQLSHAMEVANTETRVDTRTWLRRYRDSMEKLATGDIMQVAEVVKELRCIRKTKDLSFGERKMLQLAETLLEEEQKAVAHALEKS